MESNLLIEEIKSKDIDVEYFANKIIEDESSREEIVKQLLTNKDIMVYYHCYYVVSRASEIRPDLFYMYWNDFAALFNHKNSYHRDIGSDIITNLVIVDNKHCFDNNLEDYLKHINDEKFMTARHFVRNLAKVVKSRKDLIPKVIETLLAIDEKLSYPERKKELLKYDILQILDMIYIKSDFKESINCFIENALNSKSPKTKKKAKELMKKYL